jgi:hypothetical protein
MLDNSHNHRSRRNQRQHLAEFFLQQQELKMSLFGSILAGAAQGAGKAGEDIADANTKQWNAQDLLKQQADLGLAKEQALATFNNNLKNKPINDAVQYMADAGTTQLPVVAAPITKLDQNSFDGAKAGEVPIGMQGDLAAMRSQYTDMLSNPNATDSQREDIKGILAQLDTQAASQNKFAQDSVVGQTRAPTHAEIVQAAQQKAIDSGDGSAYAALKQITSDNYITVPDGGTIFDKNTGAIIGSPGMTKDQRQLAHDERVAAMHNSSQEAMAQRQLDQNKDSQFIKELKSLYPEGSPEYSEALRQRINKETGINGGAGGRSVVYNGRIVASGNEVAAALKNITDLPVQSNAGLFGSGKPSSDGLLSAGVAGLKNSLNDDQIKTYNTMWTGVSRNLGTLETSGLATTGNLVASIDKLQFVPGDNGYNALRKLAEVRQITEAALEPKLEDPAVPTQQKQFISGIIDKVRQAVPYTHADLTKFKNEQTKNPELTFSDFANKTVNKNSHTVVNSGSETSYDGWSNPRKH